MIQEKPKTNFAASALKRVKWFTSTKYTEQSKISTMYELNREIKVLTQQKISQELELFTKQSSLLCMRPLLTDGMSKDGTVAYFRYIMTSPEVCRCYKKLNIPLLVSKILEKESSSDPSKGNQAGKNRLPDKQIMQCLKFIQKWIDVAPSELPKLLVSSLVAFSELPSDESAKKDCSHISEKKLAIAALRKLSTNNPELCAWSGGINVLLSAIIDPQMEDISSDIVCTILLLINQPNIRSKTHSYLDLSKIFWIFTDIDYNPDKKDKQAPQAGKARMQIQLDLGKKAIIKIFKSWVGLVYLGSEISVLKSFVQSLRQKIRPEVRSAIYQVLQSLLMIGSNASAEQRQASNKLRIANLLNCYLITLVQLLIDCDLFKILVELSGLQDQQITVPAQKFLKQLTILMFNSLPNSSKYIDFLISSVTQEHEGAVSLSLKSCSSFVINKIGNYVFDKKPKQQNIKLLSELQNLYTPSILYIPLTQASLSEANYMMSLVPDSDTDTKLKNIYETTAMLRQSKQKYQRWKWQAVQQILKHPYDNKTKNLLETQNHRQNKLIKYLLKFYSPRKRQFSNESWHIDNFRYIKVGQLLVKNILNLNAFIKMFNEPSPSQFDITCSFFDDLKLAMKFMIEDTIAKKRVNPNFYLTLERELILWVGLFSESKKGYQELLIHNELFEMLEEYIDKPNCEYILSVLLMSFDYSKENQRKVSKEGRDSREVGCRDLLEKCLMRGPKQLTLQALEVLRMLYKTEVAGFNNWGFKLYSRFLKHKDLRDCELLNTVMELLQEIFQQEQNVADFIEFLSFEDLARIKDNLSSKFLINLLSTQKGFVNIIRFLEGWLDQQYDRWITTKNVEYNDHMEDSLNKAFTFSEPNYKGYMLRQPNSELDLLYMYKLPWVMKLGETTYPMFCRWKRNMFYLEAEIGQKITSRQAIVLMIGVMEIDQQMNMDGEMTPSKKFDFSQVEEKLQKGIKKPNGTVEYTENGITYTFQDRPDRADKPADVHLLIRVRVEVRIHRTFDNAELPKHLIGQLAKTASGVKYLRSKKAMEYFVGSLEKVESPMLVRASLWALGQLGSSDLGIELIKEYGIIDILIRMTYSHTLISLRGSCRYILNMLCASQQGRKQIVKQGWLTNRNSNIGWICVPAVSTKFFKIDKAEDNYWAANGQYWSEYHSQQQPLNQKQKKMLSNIAMLSNTLSQKAALGQIKQMKKANPDLTQSVKLLRNVVMMMTFYKFRAEVRRFIFSIFDEQIRNAQFLNDPQSSKLYIV